MIRYFVLVAGWFCLVYVGSIAGIYAYDGGVVPAGHSAPLLCLCAALTFCFAIVDRIGVICIDWLIARLQHNKPS